MCLSGDVDRFYSLRFLAFGCAVHSLNLTPHLHLSSLNLNYMLVVRLWNTQYLLLMIGLWLQPFLSTEMQLKVVLCIMTQSAIFVRESQVLRKPRRQARPHFFDMHPRGTSSQGVPRVKCVFPQERGFSDSHLPEVAARHTCSDTKSNAVFTIRTKINNLYNSSVSADNQYETLILSRPRCPRPLCFRLLLFRNAIFSCCCQSTSGSYPTCPICHQSWCFCCRSIGSPDRSGTFSRSSAWY